MDARTYVMQRQISWAHRHGIALQGSAIERGQRAFTLSVDANLFRPLSEVARRDYQQGDGGELGNGGKPGKIQAVHSSAALAVNLFDYWRVEANVAAIAEASKVPASGATSMTFEQKLPIAENPCRTIFPKDPNLDVVISYVPGSPIRMTGIECKFTEAYGGREHGGIKAAYLDHQLGSGDLWKDIPHCRKLAETIREKDSQFPHLHPAQLIKHILGLRHACGGTNQFRLLYLWYDVPFDAGAEHRREIEKFAQAVEQDGIEFQAITYQEVILNLAAKQRDRHRVYIDYLTERYL